MTLSRRKFFSATGAVLVTGLAAQACGSSSGSGSTAASGGKAELSFQLGWIANVENMGPYVAKNSGYYAKQGLDVSLIPGGPSVTTEPLVTSGKAFTALDTVDTIARARLQGAPLKVVAVTLQNNPSGVMSLAKKPIRTPKDLVGKRLGVQSSGHAEYNAFLTMNGVDPSKVTYVPVQFDPSPLVDGQVDAFASFQTSEPIQLKLQGVDTYTFLLADFGYNLWSDAYMVTEDTLNDSAARSQLVGLLRGSVAGWRSAVADPGAAAKLIVNDFGKSLGLTLKSQQLTAEAFVPLVQTSYTKQNGLLTMPEAAMETNLRTMRTEGIKITASELFDTSIMKEVFEGAGAATK